MRRDILERLQDEFMTGVYQEEIKVGNHTFTLKVLNAEEEAWANSFMNVEVKLGDVAILKLATLAISTVAIDGVNIKEIFAVDVVDGENRKVFNDEKFKIAEVVLEFYKELPLDIVNYLYDKYSEMLRKRGEHVKNFLKS